MQLQGWLGRIIADITLKSEDGLWLLATCFSSSKASRASRTTTRKKNHIEIQSFSFGGANNGSFNTATGGGTSKVNLQDIHFTKQIDKSSPNLFGVLTHGKHIDKATITVRKAGGDPKDYLIDHADALPRLVLQHQRARRRRHAVRRAFR